MGFTPFWMDCKMFGSIGHMRDENDVIKKPGTCHLSNPIRCTRISLDTVRHCFECAALLRDEHTWTLINIRQLTKTFPIYLKFYTLNLDWLSELEFWRHTPHVYTQFISVVYFWVSYESSVIVLYKKYIL